MAVYADFSGKGKQLFFMFEKVKILKIHVLKISIATSSAKKKETVQSTSGASTKIGFQFKNKTTIRLLDILKYRI